MPIAPIIVILGLGAFAWWRSKQARPALSKPSTTTPTNGGGGSGNDKLPTEPDKPKPSPPSLPRKLTLAVYAEDGSAHWNTSGGAGPGVTVEHSNDSNWLFVTTTTYPLDVKVNIVGPVEHPEDIWLFNPKDQLTHEDLNPSSGGDSTFTIRVNGNSPGDDPSIAINAVVEASPGHTSISQLKIFVQKA